MSDYNLMILAISLLIYVYCFNYFMTSRRKRDINNRDSILFISPLSLFFIYEFPEISLTLALTVLIKTLYLKLKRYKTKRKIEKRGDVFNEMD